MEEEEEDRGSKFRSFITIISRTHQRPKTVSNKICCDKFSNLLIFIKYLSTRHSKSLLEDNDPFSRKFLISRLQTIFSHIETTEQINVLRRLLLKDFYEFLSLLLSESKGFHEVFETKAILINVQRNSCFIRQLRGRHVDHH